MTKRYSAVKLSEMREFISEKISSNQMRIDGKFGPHHVYQDPGAAGKCCTVGWGAIFLGVSPEDLYESLGGDARGGGNVAGMNDAREFETALDMLISRLGDLTEGSETE